ncbi:MAG: CdaR family protein [Thermodesulfobacteriota bacterium]
MHKAAKKRFNLKWLLLSAIIVAFAASYWHVAHFHEATLTIGLEVYAIPEDFTVVDPPSQTIEVRVRGPRSAVRKAADTDITYKANLSDAGAGVNPIAIDPEELPLADDITVVSVSIDDKTITLENTIEKKLPVRVQSKGNAAFGYRVKEKRVDPSKVTLRGPESKLSPLTAVKTHAIDITGASKTIQEKITLDLPESVQVLPDQQPLSASIVIGAKTTEKTLENVIVTGRNTPYFHIIQPDTIRLTIRAAQPVFAGAFSRKNVSVFLELEGLAPGIYVKPAIIRLPDNISLVRADPQVFTVQIKKTPPASGGP